MRSVDVFEQHGIMKEIPEYQMIWEVILNSFGFHVSYSLEMG